MSNFVNRFHVYAYGDTVRIIFTDCVEGTEGVIQSNLVMRIDDAVALTIAITQAIGKCKENSK